MGESDLTASWASARRHLAQARSLLPARASPGTGGGTVEGLREYLDQDEFELALDCLADIGAANSAGAAFWRALIGAAGEMGLRDRSAEYRKRLGRDPP